MDNALLRKETVIIRREWYEAITAIPSANERAEAYSAIMEYAFEGTIYEGANATIKMLFALVRPAIDRANESYAKQVIQGRENGHKGGRPRKTPRDNEKPQGFLKKPLKTRVKPKRFCQINIQYTLGKEFQPTVTIVFFELLK